MPVFTIAKLFLASPVSAIWQWIKSGGWKVLLIALGLALSALAVRSCAKQGAETKAAQEGLKSAQGEIVLLDKASAATAQAETSNIGSKALIDRKEAQGLARSKAALSAHQDWASQPIPADIIASLQDR